MTVRAERHQRVSAAAECHGNHVLWLAPLARGDVERRTEVELVLPPLPGALRRSLRILVALRELAAPKAKLAPAARLVRGCVISAPPRAAAGAHRRLAECRREEAY